MTAKVTCNNYITILPKELRNMNITHLMFRHAVDDLDHAGIGLFVRNIYNCICR